MEGLNFRFGVVLDFTRSKPFLILALHETMRAHKVVASASYRRQAKIKKLPKDFSLFCLYWRNLSFPQSRVRENSVVVNFENNLVDQIQKQTLKIKYKFTRITRESGSH